MRPKWLEKHLMPYRVCATAGNVITRIITQLVSQQPVPLKVLSLPLSCCSFSLAAFLPVSLSLPVRLSLAVCVSLGWLELLGSAGDKV